MSVQMGCPEGASAECGSDMPSASPTTCAVAAVPRNWQPPPGEAQARHIASAASSSVICPWAKRAPTDCTLAVSSPSSGSSVTHLEPAPEIEPWIGRLPCGCSATELYRLEPKRGFELRSGRYERPVLPIELIRLERVRRIELRWLDWRSSAQPMSHTREVKLSAVSSQHSAPNAPADADS